MSMLVSQSPLATKDWTIRAAEPRDIPFLARMMYEAALPPLNHCFWGDFLVGLDTPTIAFLEAILRADGCYWGSIQTFWILEERGEPIAAAAGYESSVADYCPVNRSRLDQIAQHLHWTAPMVEQFRQNYAEFWGGDYQPPFLKPFAPWTIESVAVAPQARGRGAGKFLVQFLIDLGRDRQYSHAGIMIINGNVVAQRTYESLGFKPYQTFHADYFQGFLNQAFPGLTGLRRTLQTTEGV